MGFCRAVTLFAHPISDWLGFARRRVLRILLMQVGKIGRYFGADVGLGHGPRRRSFDLRGNDRTLLWCGHHPVEHTPDVVVDRRP